MYCILYSLWKVIYKGFFFSSPHQGISRDVKIEPSPERKLSRNRASLFVFAMEGLENMAFVCVVVSLMTYFSGYMNFSLTKSATTLTNFVGTSFLLALFGGFICDTYWTRFKTCVLFGCVEFLGYALLTVQAHFHQLRPIPCKGVSSDQCEAADGGQSAILFTGLYLIAFGTSGIKAALPSLGADQFDENDPEEATQLSSFFNWFLLSLTIGGIVGVTIIVWISANHGWDLGFGVCAVAVFFAIISVSMGKSFYRNNVPKGSPLSRVAQVFVAAIRNRDLPIPERAEELHEIHDKEAGVLGPGSNRQHYYQCIITDQPWTLEAMHRIPTGIRHLQRIGVGLVLSAISMAVSGVVETWRKSVAFEHNMVDSTELLPMSFLWLGFQFAIFGAADMFTLVGLLEFLYAESSAGMKSLGTAISWCSVAFGYFMSSVVVQLVNKVTGGWLASNNLNRDKLNYFYWLLAGISTLNFGVYLTCASWYRYKNKGAVKQTGNDGEDDGKGKVQMVEI
ncbi:hypothetical protein SADUNF_Sadunf14G0021900 [Salix dunnii]|uniref:Uncharacterized protein n=1 Tax=Salix dunnii TaxID=1413687 RepID=A0A835MLT4_9ROSI|nr:hypothetical protein SADUNF_Sadunf14G0021900 [Salix dunnii]